MLMKTEFNPSRREVLRTGVALGAWHMGLPWVSAAANGSDFQIGCYTRPWDKHDYRVALDGIARAGFRYAGLMTAKCETWVLITVDSTPEAVAAIAEDVKQRGLKTLSLYGGDFPVARSIEAGMAGLKTLINHCVVCDCPNLLLGGTGDEKLVKDYYKVVSECCDYAAAKGVGMSIKPHGGQNATGAQCRKIIEQVGHSNFKLWYDPGNIYYYSDGQRDPVADAVDVDGLVVGMSVKDFLPPKEVLVTPGQGQVKFKAVMNRLKLGGFRQGPLIVECLHVGDLEHLHVEAQKARQFIETLIKEI
jgi:sugar phosphate isomerase/epimerase